MIKLTAAGKSGLVRYDIWRAGGCAEAGVHTTQSEPKIFYPPKAGTNIVPHGVREFSKYLLNCSCNVQIYSNYTNTGRASASRRTNWTVRFRVHLFEVATEPEKIDNYK
ncbi:hypothetical protein EVAR_44198_1 [Eumeta japonica]|uniref:Uncharacterized protein n=1 Tax=Eumeta variegata TaxID=151549 RepID=A0A4C1W1F8_EUMVA|nr:hypothetical protein EVAR_44198_1 [Eumeta japonica]